MTALAIDRDEQEWQAIEATARVFHHRIGHSGTAFYYPPDAGAQWAGPKVSDRPHPESYGASLPIRSQLNTPRTLTSTSKAERYQLALHPLMLVQDSTEATAVRQCRGDIGRVPAIKEQLEKRRAAVRKRASELPINIATRES